MNSAQKIPYVPSWREGARVRFSRRGHPDFEQNATIVAVLPNPSGLQDRQWYDVRFDNGRYGRFLERYLERVESVPEARLA